MFARGALAFTADSWLQKSVTRVLKLDHCVINSWTTRGALKFVDSRTGELLPRGKECVDPNIDSDLLIRPDMLLRYVRSKLQTCSYSRNGSQAHATVPQGSASRRCCGRKRVQ